MTETRRQLLSHLAARLDAQPAAPVLRVAVDGVDGAGKTTFADELADALRALGRDVFHASVDGFHHPRERRYRLGRNSPEGFYRDSYDHAALRRVLLDPLGPGGSGWYRTAVFDVDRDVPVQVPGRHAPAGSVLIVDGLFLHRPELRNAWDDSVFLRVPFEVSVPRGRPRAGVRLPGPGGAVQPAVHRREPPVFQGGHPGAAGGRDRGQRGPHAAGDRAGAAAGPLTAGAPRPGPACFTALWPRKAE